MQSLSIDFGGSYAVRLRRFGAEAGRYAISTLGPVVMAAAHFLAAGLVLHTLSRQEFGIFSFVVTIVPFCVGAAGALVGAPIITGVRDAGRVDEIELALLQKVNLVFASVVGAVVGSALLATGPDLVQSLLFGLYGAAMSLRSLGRSHACAVNAPWRGAISDVAYGALISGGLGVLYALGRVNMTLTALLFVIATLLSMLSFDCKFLRGQLKPPAAGRLVLYRPVWRDLTRWSLLGVAATELTVNAHAYFVTFVYGPSAFALLALGSLLLRPASLVISALPDLERPVLARAIGAGNLPCAMRTLRQFRFAGLAAWLGSSVLAIVLLLWFPLLVLKQHYDVSQARLSVALWIAIMGLRVLRTPEAVFLQAAGKFQQLAEGGVVSGIVSLVTTLTLLLAFGPLASLVGILVGDVVLMLKIFTMIRAWRRTHA